MSDCLVFDNKTPTTAREIRSIAGRHAITRLAAEPH
jgi:hypothetical protein